MKITNLVKKLVLSLLVMSLPVLVAQPVFAASANYVSNQTYLNAAPAGMGISGSAGIPGALGKNVRIADLEFAWNTSHEDLPKSRASGALWAVGTPVNPYNNAAESDAVIQHGTAVSGLISAARNGYGIDGVAPDAEFHMVNTYSQEYGWDIARAVNLAASRMSAGDVILIEQQVSDGRGNSVPAEWDSRVYDAIRSATSNGIIVVEAAGNSKVNLDDSYYGSSFPMGKPDSGAVIVGAGSACDGSANHYRWQPTDIYGSNYGSRVDVQGFGECVMTTGYGTTYGGYGSGNTAYLPEFKGTSSAAALVAAAAANISSTYEELYKTNASPTLVRFAMMVTGTPQYTAINPGKVGPLVNQTAAIKALDNTAPSTPKGLTYTFNSSKQPVIKWQAATDNTRVASYRVYRNGSLVSTVSGTTLKYVDKSFSAKTTYSYQIQAVDAVGNTSAKSAKLSLTTK